MPLVLRVLAGLLFLSIALGVLGGTHLYLAQRLILDPALPPALERALLAVLIALGASIFLLPIGQRLLPLRVMRVLAWPPSLWMGTFFLLFVGVAVTDLAVWLVGRSAEAGVLDVSAQIGSARARAAGIALVTGGAVVWAVITALRGPVLRKVRVALPRWPASLDGFRIVQISDLHIGPLLGRDFAEQVVARCNALEPDLLALTGDLVDGPVSKLRDEVEPFRGLRARHGVYFVTGNHDHYSGAQDWVDVVEELGFRVLRNERVTIEREGGRFELAGVDDHNGSFERGWREDLPAALEGRDPGDAVVLLAHDPRSFGRPRTMDVDLQLSGHTPGGQIWPFRYLVRIYTRWVAGLYHERGCTLYVSRGTGFWGPPMRLLAPAEITEIELRRGAA